MMDDKAILLASLAILAILIAAGFIYIVPSFENPKVVFFEAPLYKNKQLQLVPGESYIYSLDMNGSVAKATYLIGQGDSCTLIRMMESVNFSGACLDRFGNDRLGYNTSLEASSVLMFQPWMLALKEGWTWNSTMYLSYDGKLKKVGSSSYRVIRSENYSGRLAYIVELKSDDGPAEYEWVDDEKRILLKLKGQGYEVEMVNSTMIDADG